MVVLLTAAAAATVAVSLLVVLRDAAPAPAHTATPEPLTYEAVDGAVTAAAQLEHLAAAASRDTAHGGDPAPNAGRTEHLHITSWHLHSQIAGRTTTSAVVAAEHESWRAPDNSGRRTERYHRPTFTSDQARRDWQQDGSPGADTEPRTETYPPGQFPALWPDRPPTDPAGLDRWLRRNHNTDGWPAATPTAITDLLRERVLTPGERAALIRLIAGLPGAEFTGAVTDRAGRRGHAFSLTTDHSGLPTRHTLILDPATGRFLAYEQMLTTTAGRLNVAVPAVIGYETYLDAGWAVAT